MTPEAIRREIQDEMLGRARQRTISAAERAASWERELVLWMQLDQAIAFDVAVSYAGRYAAEQAHRWRRYADEDAAAGVSS